MTESTLKIARDIHNVIKICEQIEQCNIVGVYSLDGWNAEKKCNDFLPFELPESTVEKILEVIKDCKKEYQHKFNNL